MYLFLVLLNTSISWFIVLQGCPRKGQGCHGCSASPGPFVSSRQPDYSIYDKYILSRFEFEVSHEANVVQAWYRPIMGLGKVTKNHQQMQS